MGHVVSFPPDRHHETQLLLPWYATGQLDESERLLVEAHLADCAECRADLAAEQRLKAAVADGSPAAEQGWETLRARAVAPIVPGRRPQRRWMAVGRGLARPERLRWLVAAQFAALLVVGAAALPSSSPSPQYRTLGDAPAAHHGNVLAMFQPDTSEAELRHSLEGVHARLVDGPTAAGAYVLEVPGATAIETLRHNPHVTMAEPISQAPSE